MIGRAVTYKMKPGSLPEIQSIIDAARAKMAKVPGVVVSCSMWNDDGSAYTFSLWESAAAAEAAQPALKDIWEVVFPHLDAPPQVQTFSHAAKMAG